MNDHRIPRIPADLIPLIEALVGRPEGFVPCRRTPRELEKMRNWLPHVAEEFGADSAIYSRVLLVTALEYARAEAIPS